MLAWSGVAHVNIGGGDNYVRGDASFTFAKNAAGFVLDLDLHADARLSIPGVRFDGRVTGHLQVRSDAAGHVTYDAGSLAVSGHVSAYNPFTGGWNDLGPAGVSVSLNGRHLHVTAHAGGASYGFDLDLP